MALLEVCCYSVACAHTAQQAGADRIELCSAPSEGGLTPSWGMLQTARREIMIPVHPIIRPRGGDFCYDDHEFSVMLADIQAVRSLGFPGIVTGILDADGQVDLARMDQVMAAAGEMAVTFHRAFDMCRDPYLAFEQLGRLGVARILTSGQQASAEKGIALLTELKSRSCVPTIMAGSGVRPENISLFIQQGIEEVHSSAGEYVASPMRYRHTGVSMSSDADADEFRRYRVSSASVTAMKRLLARQTLEN